MDFRQTQAFAKYLESSGWKTEILPNGTYVFIFPIFFLGTILRIPRPEGPIDFKQIDSLAKKHNAILVKIEPDAYIENKNLLSDLLQHGYAQDKWSVEPTKTLKINLSYSIDELYRNLRKTWRNNIKRAKAKGIEVKQSSNIDLFLQIWKTNVKRKEFVVEKQGKLRILWDEFRLNKKCFLLFVSINKDAIGGIMLIGSKDTMHLWHVAYTGERQDTQPMHMLLWESILFAKSKNYKYFDFEGISDSRFPYTKSLQPDYFKKGFGGKEKEFIGSFVKYYNYPLSIPFKLLGLIKPNLLRTVYKKLYG